MQVSARASLRWLLGVSSLALAVSSPTYAQDPANTVGQPGDSETPPVPVQAETQPEEEIVVTGIRASLRASVDIKRDAQGVVDAISAEDIGKFPDTNLAESLQRITGVSIQRDNGEGSFVTVRGFGPEFNLVTLNGRQMPTSSLGDGASPPSSRSFDFANLASEGIAAVEVYKTGRASVPSGGIGSSINIRTPRPLDRSGFRGSFAVKAVWDSSREGDVTPTPEFSGIISQTFADNRIGILATGSFQKRKASVNQANVGWRDGYLGSENNWGSLPQTGGDIINRPGPDDVYEVPQNASYDLNDIDRERINGQLVLQFRPTDSLTGTLDYTYSRNTVEVRNSNVGIWFNHGDTSSEWTDGPVAGPVFYSETFAPPDPGCFAPAPCNIGKDLSYSGSLTANRSINKSLGGNLTWNGLGGLTLTVDAHHSTAESKPSNDFGTSVSVGNAIFGVVGQGVNFDEDLPIISYTMAPDRDPFNRALITPTGNAFRNAYFKDTINQAQLIGRYDFDTSFLDSVDFGVSYTENKIRSAYGFLQSDSWGGAGPASDIPDDIFQIASLPDRFDGVSGSNDPSMIQSFYTFDFERMVDLIEGLYGSCSNALNGAVAIPGTCLAEFTVDRRTKERTWSPYIQVNNTFDLFARSAHLIAGVRYEKTKVTSSALVPVPSATRWVADNEFSVIGFNDSAFTTFKGDYDHWLPAVDFDMQPIQDVKLRASYSHTITRADYASLQGGRTIDSLFRVGGGTGSQGNPGLLPYKSKNIDLSAEWYYGPESYASIGYFRKRVSNFLSTTVFDTDAFGLRTPVGGPRYLAAVAALGPNAGATQIRQYIATNFPDTVEIQPNGQIFINTLPEDPLLNFEITTPFNGDQTAKLRGWEFAIQHSFWNTGFGAILNYTIVRGDATYDNTQPHTVSQFALTGLSDSANAVLFYDKDGLQARVAYNWRDEYLQGSGPNPTYIEAYGQVDASASWEFRPGFTIFGEVINLTGEGRRGHRRSDRNVTFASPGYARYAAGLRVTF